ncbi:MAG: NCS2 family permease [Chlamydiales bacterium]
MEKINKKQLYKEILAGLTSFTTISYILLLNPLILADSGIPFGSALSATALIACFSTLLMGFLAGYPFLLGPSIGLSAYFTYSVVRVQLFSWQEALAACFASGCILVFLNVIGFRKLLLDSIPDNLRKGLTAGLGLFLFSIGLYQVGLIRLPNVHEYMIGFGKWTPAATLTFLTTALLNLLRQREIRSSYLICIFLIWAVSLYEGLVTWQGFLDFPPSIAPTFLQLKLSSLSNPSLWTCVLSMLIVSLFDVTGTVIALGKEANLFNHNGTLPRAKKIFFSDSTGTVVGSLMGASNIAIYLESGAGISAGGRTGMTAITGGVCFLLALFFAPLASSIPPFAASPVLITIGLAMARHLLYLDKNKRDEWIPVILMAVTIPLTFSLINGISMGIILYPISCTLAGRRKEVSWLMWIFAGILLIRIFLLV